jgi:hypothetical protein
MSAATYDVTYLPSSPFYTGPAATRAVGADYDVSIAGVGYLIDWQSGMFQHESIPAIRQQADNSAEVGEQTLNPEDLWLRGQTSWHGGAGQTYLDLADPDGGVVSNRKRFRASKGVDPWTYGELKLLRATSRVRTSADANCQMVVAGSRCYVLSGNTLYFSTDLSSWTQVTAAGAALSGPVSMSTDGFNVWIVDSTDLYYTTTSIATYARWHGSAWASSYLVRYAKGRLFTARGTVLYNHLAQGSAIPTVSSDGLAGNGTWHVNSGWTWTDMAEGPNAIYASGYAGDKSLIYRTAVADDGTGLEAFVVAAELPDGETARSMVGYLGGLLIGTDKGVRYATLDQSGSVAAMGDVIPTANPVRCFEPQERFVWYGVTNPDATSTGLGRVDLRTFTSDLTPAWANDIYAGTQGIVSSVATFGGRRVFAVASSGLWAESTTDYVTEATLNTGWFSYGLPQPKTAVQLDVAHAAGAGAYSVAIAKDHETASTPLGVAVTTLSARAAQTAWSTQLVRGEAFELRFTLTGTGSATPVLKRWTLRSQPASPTGLKITVPIILAEREKTNSGRDKARDVHAARDRINGLLEAKTVVTYQEGPETWNVVVEGTRWVPMGKRGPNRGAFDGTLVVQLKTVKVLA